MSRRQAAALRGPVPQRGMDTASKNSLRDYFREQDTVGRQKIEGGASRIYGILRFSASRLSVIVLEKSR